MNLFESVHISEIIFSLSSLAREIQKALFYVVMAPYVSILYVVPAISEI